MGKMNGLMTVLACLACAGTGRRVQASLGQVLSSPLTDSEEPSDVTDPVSDLHSHAELNYAAAFMPGGVHGEMGHPRLNTVRPAAFEERHRGLPCDSTMSSPVDNPSFVDWLSRKSILGRQDFSGSSSEGREGGAHEASLDTLEVGTKAAAVDDEEPWYGNVHRTGMILMAQLPETMAEVSEADAITAPTRLRSAAAAVARTAASLASIIAIDLALRRLFVAQSIPFPSALAGMMLLFVLLCAAQAVRPKVASRFASAAAPGCAFITRWLALFFVPNLVILPIALKMSVLEVVKVFGIIIVGLLCSLPLAALTGARILGTSGSTEPSTSTPAASAGAVPTPKKPWMPVLASIGGTGVAALLSYRALGGCVISSIFEYAHLLTCTVSGFVAGQQLVPKPAQKVLHPVITTAVVTQTAIAAFAALTAQPVYAVLRGYLVPGGTVWSAPGNLLLFMLGPATLSFAFQMFSRRQLMAQSAAAVAGVISVSAAFGLFSTALAGRMLGLPEAVRLAAMPRQVTAPLAIAIAGILRTDPSLAATITVLTGLFAANFGRTILDIIKVHQPVARGLAMGAAAHGLGTAAMAEEKDAFPFAAIALALNATLTTVLVSIPAIRRLLLSVAGIPSA